MRRMPSGRSERAASPYTVSVGTPTTSPRSSATTAASMSLTFFLRKPTLSVGKRRKNRSWQTGDEGAVAAGQIGADVDVGEAGLDGHRRGGGSLRGRQLDDEGAGAGEPRGRAADHLVEVFEAGRT